MAKLKAGVIGVGAMGRNHARVYSEIPGVKLIGVADLNEDVVNSVARSTGSQPFLDYCDLLGEKLDIVSIVVPTTLHKRVALDAMDSGANVLIEKPLAESVESVEGILKVARKKGLKLMAGYIERFNPAVMKLKQLLDAGELGDVVSISAKRVGPFNPRIRDVGIILDLGTHDIDMMCYLYGERVTEVFALAGSIAHGQESHAIITLSFRGGGSGVIETSWLIPHKVRNLTVIGSKGIAEVDYLESSLRLFDKEWIRDAKVEKQEPLKLELGHFVDCVLNDREPLVSGEDAEHVLQVALAAIDSFRNKEVRIIK